MRAATFILPFLLLFIFTGCLFQSADKPSPEHASLITQESLEKLKENNITSIVCTGKYLDFLNEFTITGKVIKTDQSELYNSRKFFDRNELFVIDLHDEPRLFISPEIDTKELSVARNALYSCLQGYIKKREYESKARLENDKIYQKLIFAEENNDANLSAKEYRHIVESFSEYFKGKDFDVNSFESIAPAINEVINLDTAFALDVREGPQNLHGIIKNLNTLKRRELTKYTMVELGIEYDEAAFKKHALTMELLNTLLKENQNIDTATELDSFIKTIFKLDLQREKNVFDLSRDDYLLMGVELKGEGRAEEYVYALNLSLKLCDKNRFSLRHNIAYIKRTFKSLKRLNEGMLEESDLAYIGVSLPDGIEKESLFEAVNSVIVLKNSFYGAYELDALLKSLHKFNLAILNKNSALEIKTYRDLGINTKLVNIRELGSFIDKRVTTLNSPKMLYDYSKTLEHFYAGKVLSEDISTLGFEEDFARIKDANSSLKCVNDVLALRGGEKIDIAMANEVISSLIRLKEDGAYMEAADLNALGIKKFSGAYLDGNDLQLFNRWLNGQNRKSICAEESAAFFYTFTKLLDGEKQNNSSLSSKEYQIIGVESDTGAVDEKFAAALNEIVNSDRAGMIEVAYEPESIRNMAKALFRFQAGKYDEDDLRSIGVYPGETGLEYLKEALIFSSKKELSPSKINLFAEFLNRLVIAKKSRSAAFSKEEYSMLGLSLEDENDAALLNEVINSEYSLKIEESVKNFAALLNGIKALRNRSVTQQKLNDIGIKIENEKHYKEMMLLLGKHVAEPTIEYISRLLESIRRFDGIEEDKKQTYLSREDFALLGLREKTSGIPDDMLSLFNERMARDKESVTNELLDNLVSFYEKNECNEEMISSLMLRNLHSLKSELFCSYIAQNKPAFASIAHLDKKTIAYEHLVEAKIGEADIVFLGYGLPSNKNAKSALIDTINSRLADPDLAQEEKIALLEELLGKKTQQGYISGGITKEEIEKYGISAPEDFLADSEAISFINSAIDNQARPVDGEILRKIVAAATNIFKAFEGISRVAAGDLETLGLLNKNSEAVTALQEELISEKIRIERQKSGRYTLLKEALLSTYETLYEQ